MFLAAPTESKGVKGARKEGFIAGILSYLVVSIVWKVLALLFVYGRSSHGVAIPIRVTPRDGLSIQKSNAC